MTKFEPSKNSAHFSARAGFSLSQQLIFHVDR